MTQPPALANLFNHYGSDKDRNGYTPYYEALFKHLRHRPVQVLEVGIGTLIPGACSSMVNYALPHYRPGGSLRAWRDYFPQGQIMGVDIQADTQFSEERIRTGLCSSDDLSALNNVLGDQTFDIIIDDGSHWDEIQCTTLKNLWPRLRPGGFYVIEDVLEGSRIPREFLPRVLGYVDPDVSYFFSQKQNLLFLSKPCANVP